MTYALRRTSSPTRLRGQPRQLDGRGQLAEPARPVPTDHGRDEDEQLVDEALCEERGRERRPALEQQRLHVVGGESRELVGQRAGAELERRPVRERPATERQPPGLADDRDVARVERRVVGPDRAHADRDRVRRRTELVHAPS